MRNKCTYLCDGHGVKHESVSLGFGPGHSLSGRLAIVLVNSRKILQLTSRFRKPSPHSTLHGPHCSATNLSEKFSQFINFDIEL